MVGNTCSGLSPQHHHDGLHGNLCDLHLLLSQRSLCQTQELPVPRRYSRHTEDKHILLAAVQNQAQCCFSSGTLMSGLSLLVLMSLINMFFGSVMLFKVQNLRSAVCRHVPSRSS